MSFATEDDFHVLALSGGGFRGLYTATVLKHLEAAVGGPLADRFDLICGTSVGGLLALGLAARIPASELQALFLADGQRIFGSRGFWRSLLPQWIIAKHSPVGLHGAISERFKDLTLGDLKHRVLIPSVNYSTGKGVFFKTPHAASYIADVPRKLVDVGMATAAAPTYFPLHRIDDQGVFADGGLVGNSPGMFGVHEAHQVLNVPRGRVKVLAVGTMTVGATIRGNSFLDRGIALWGAKLFDLVLSAQEHSTDSMLKHLLGSSYVRIDDLATPDQSKDISDLDVVTDAAIDVLTCRGAQAARVALGKPEIAPFLQHMAKQPTFFHGSNKSVQGGTNA